jgi:serine/threonine protein kinase
VKLAPGVLVDDKYRIARVLGRGGMGSDFAIEHVIVGRMMAMKVLNTWTDERDIERFKLEARAATKIGSPHIVDVLDLGQLPDGTPYMVMEYLQGETLGQRLRQRGKLTPTETAPIAMQILEGLGAAHKAGIVHRDLKPDNVFLARIGNAEADQVKLLDFGVALSRTATNRTSRLTRTGVAVGTPSYMSPEQASAERDLDATTDVYAVGVILYQALSGRLPFDAKNMQGLVAQIVMGKVTPLSRLAPNADRAWVTLITKAMSRRPQNRFQSAAEFQAAVSAWIEDQGARHALESSTAVGSAVSRTEQSSYEALGIASTVNAIVDAPKSVRVLVTVAAAVGVCAGTLALVHFRSGDAPKAASASSTTPGADPAQAGQILPAGSETVAPMGPAERAAELDSGADTRLSRTKSRARNTGPRAAASRGTTVTIAAERHTAANAAPSKTTAALAAPPKTTRVPSAASKMIPAPAAPSTTAPVLRDGRRVGVFE